MTTIMTLVGMTTLLLVAFIASTNRSAINLRTVGCAFGLQVLIGGFVLYFPAGQDVLVAVSTKVSSVISYATDGISFLFGDLASGKMGFVFALNVLPIIVLAGYDPLWFGIFLVFMVELSQITPPVGFSLFVIQSISGEKIEYILKATLPFFILMIVAVLLITFFPEIVHYLPNQMIK